MVKNRQKELLIGLARYLTDNYEKDPRIKKQLK